MSASARDLPPVPAIQRYFEISLYLLVATGILAVISTGKLDLLTTVAPPAALIFKGIRVWRGRGPELSGRVATALVLGYMLFFPADVWFVSRTLAEGTPNPPLYAGLLAATHMMIFASLVRLFSARSTRDYVFLTMLAFTAMLASAILTVDTAFLVSLAIFLVLSVSTFVALEIRRGAEGAVSPPLEAGTPAARQLQRSLGITSVLVAPGTLALGIAIFFCIPRFATGYLNALNLRPTLMTGFSENVSLGEIGRIKKSSAVVMRVRVEGDPSRAQTVRWRGIALTNFDGRRWTTPSRTAMALTPAADGVFRPLPDDPLPLSDKIRMRYSVLLEPIATSAVFLAPRPAEIWGNFEQPPEHPGEEHRGFLVLDSTGSIFLPGEAESKMRYEAVSELPKIAPAKLREAAAEYPESIRQSYLQLPNLDPRIPRLAGEITRAEATPYDKAASIERYLRAQFKYTLDLSGPSVRDPLAHFLFERRAGHCEYFAAAMVVLLRTQGIPARYVTGFLPGEYNDLAGDFIVRASDAHSWVEVYFPRYGWITFDPTPPGAPSPHGWLARLGLYWDWLQYTWGEWIINYDFAHQVTLAQNVQHATRAWSERARRFYQSKRRQTLEWMKLWQDRISRSPHALQLSLALLLLMLLFLRGRAIGGYVLARWSLHRHRHGGLPPGIATLEYREMLRLLEKRGWRKSEGQTALEFASHIPPGEMAAPVAEFTGLYQEARFGAHAGEAVRMSSLLARIREIVQSRRVRRY